MANIKSINGNPIVVGTDNIENDSVTDAKLSQFGIKHTISGMLAKTKNLLPVGYQQSNVRGTTAVYDNGILELTGECTFSGGRGIKLAPPFVLDAGTYYFSTNGITSAVDKVFIEKTSDDSIVRAGAGSFTLTESTELYIGVNLFQGTTYSEHIELQVEAGAAATDFVSPLSVYDKKAQFEIGAIDGRVSNVEQRFDIINRVDISTEIEHAYVDSNGGFTHTDAPYNASQYIYIGDLDTVSYSYTFKLALYDESKVFVSAPDTQASVGSVVTIDVPSGVAFMVVSYQAAHREYVQVGSSISLSQYYPHGKFRMPDLVTDEAQDAGIVYVSKSGRGSYTSLLEALFSTTGDIEVVDGAFDIVAEYESKFGSDFFEPNHDRSAAGDFALGLYITGRSVKFDANTTISFDLTENPASNVSGDDRRFSLFNLGVDVVLDGAIGTTAYNWYAIHDDGAGGDYAANYKNVIKNCIIISTNMVNANSIGGGCGRYSVTEIENCYFDNGGADSTYTVRYHNTWNGQAQPVVRISNCWINAKFYFGYYGSSTKVGTCTVNNCSMKGSIDLVPVTGQSVENLRVLEWCNEIRAE